MKVSKIIAAVSVALASLSAHAGVVVGGSTMLNDQGLAQLESWLGQGDLLLTNVFTKQAGSTALDFHAAADGKGATFVLMRASEDYGSTWKTVGGYDPKSWASNSRYNSSSDPTTFTGFIFNLTDGIKKAQDNGYQTLNYPYYGPAFGGGFDLYAEYSLNVGSSNGYSYGGVLNQSIVDGSSYDGTNMKIGALEVFTVAPSAVPEPGSIAILGLGLAGLVAARRKAGQQG
jgi:hypothetical protein